MNQKVSLIKLRVKHFSLFYRWWNDSAVRHLTSGVYNKMSNQQVDQSLQKILTLKNRHDFIIKFNNELIGHVAVHKKLNRKFFEVYIAIGEKKYWGQGIGTIVMKKISRWFFRNYPKEKILQLEVLTTNPRAIRCYEKTGFKKIKIKHYKKYPDTILMEKLAKD